MMTSVSSTSMTQAFQTLGLVKLALQPFPFGLGLEALPLGLQFQPFGHVADRGHDQDALAGVDGGQGDLAGEGAAVAPAGDQFESLAHPPGPRVGDVGGPVGRVRRLDRVRDQDLRELAGQLVALVSEQPLGLRVHQHDPAVGGHADHGVGRRIEQPDYHVVREFHGAHSRPPLACRSGNCERKERCDQ
jgi:hypothetical protein